MKVSVVCVGRARSTIAELIAEYEERVGHYFSFETIEVKEAPYRGQPLEDVRAEEGKRLLARISAQTELIALHPPGKMWSSETLAKYLAEAPLRGVGAVTFIIGGAYGLSTEVLQRASQKLSLSAMTLPHELARLVLTEQLYRAGTIARGEPYHKGPDA
jgi:23S rRNA (pseudouridine1915-N3)-methyltransferase